MRLRLIIALSATAAALVPSWQTQLDRVFLDIDMKPRTRSRTLFKVIERREEILTDVRSAVDSIREKGFKDGHGEAIDLLFPKGTIIRGDLEGLQSLRKQLPEAIEDLRKTRPTTTASTPSPPKPEDLRKVAEKLRDGSLQSDIEEELKNALRSTPKGLETPKYKVEKTFGDCEVRTYEAYAVAELNEKRPDGDAFNILAAYLFGKNSEDKAMAMTMPVEMVDGVMSFFLPKADADAPPAPTDDKVTIGARPARTVVALPFPGVATPEEIERQRSKLADVLKAEGLEAADDSYTVLQYNSPFTIPWRRRNELVVALAENAAPKPLVRRKAQGERGPAPPAMPRAAWRSSVRAGANVSFERAMVCLRADVVGEHLMGMSYANKLKKARARPPRMLLCVSARGCRCEASALLCAAARLALRVGERALLVHNHWLQTSCHSK